MNYQVPTKHQLSVGMWDSSRLCFLHLPGDDKPKVFLTKDSIRVKNVHLSNTRFFRSPGIIMYTQQEDKPQMSKCLSNTTHKP